MDRARTVREGMNRQEIRILVANDEPDLVKSLARILKRHGYSVQGAVGGTQAVALARELCPQVVIMDVKMHDGEGLEAFHKIKQVCPECAVLFHTGLPEEQVHEADATAMVPKPFDIDNLLESLDILEVG